MNVTARSARLTDTLVFGIVGALFATWAVRIPAISSSLGLSSGDIALAMAGLACGSLVGLPLSGVLVSRIGSRQVIRIGLCVYCVALPLVALSGSLAMLVALVFLFGFGKGLIDVAANTQGVRIETAYGTDHGEHSCDIQRGRLGRFGTRSGRCWHRILRRSTLHDDQCRAAYRWTRG